MIQVPDTIIYDAAKIAEYQSDSRYDYNSQLTVSSADLIQMFYNWLAQHLHPLFGSRLMTDNLTVYISVALFVALLLALIYFVYKKHPELFIKDKKVANVPYEVEQETIYGIDFDKELQAAMAANDFREAVRIVYLQTLRYVSDKHWIDWQIFKTPTEYIYELKLATLRPVFRAFTNHFLQVRYGNFKATQVLVDEMCELRKTIEKGGGDEGE